MTIINNEHLKRHTELHKCLDELLADYIAQTDSLPEYTSLWDFIAWSFKQTTQPDHSVNDFKGVI